MEDTKKELERLEKALLADETMAVPLVGEEDLTDDLPEDLTAGLDESLAAELLEELAEPQQEAAEEPEETAEEIEVTAVEDSILDALLAEVSGPAFDDPDALPETDETMVFRNFSNDFGNDLTRYGEEEEEEKTPEEKKRDDKVVIGLEIAACALCLGIIGVLIYWLVAFL